MKAVYKLLLCAILVLPLSGCWDSRDIQNIAYVSALGVDYIEGKFHVYVQILNFSNVAKNDQVTIGAPVPIWTGKGVGTTFTDAIDEIIQTLELKLFMGHLKAIVVSERLLEQEHKVKELYESLNRQRDVRYNVWLFGTKEDMLDILTQKSILNLSPVDTMLIQEGLSYRQGGYIEPIYGFKVIANLNEPGRTLRLPSLALTKKVWREDKKDKNMFVIDGAFIINGSKERQYKGWLSIQDMLGSRWVQKKLNISYVTIPDLKHPTAGIVLYQPKFKISIDQIQGDKVTYQISVRVNGYVNQLIRDATVSELQHMTEKKVAEEVLQTYRIALSRDIDILSLNGLLYRSHPKIWKRLQTANRIGLDEDSISKLDVKVHLIHMGRYKVNLH
jgi:spore germination protein KC